MNIFAIKHRYKFSVPTYSVLMTALDNINILLIISTENERTLV